MARAQSKPSEISNPVAGAAVTDLILEVFRLNGRLLASGDRLVAGLGLTSARWQVLGAVALSPMPQTVACLARNRGLKRQGVQRIVNEMEKDGFVEYRNNPHHRNSRLVVLSDLGQAAFEATSSLQKPWAVQLAQGHDAKTLNAATRIIADLSKNLERM